MRKTIYFVLIISILLPALLAKNAYADTIVGDMQVLVIDKNTFDRIQGATVTIIDGPNCQNSMAGITNSSGVVTFQNLIEGNYKVKVDAANYATEVATGIISVTGTNNQEVYLNPTATQKLTLSVDSGGSVTFINGFQTTPTFSNGVTQTFALPHGSQIVLQATPYIPHSSCGLPSKTHFNEWAGMVGSSNFQLSFSMDNDIVETADFGEGYGLPSPTHQNAGPSPGIPSLSTQDSHQTIPSWIKNNARWWSHGQIGKSDFIDGIQYLIKNGIMKVPQTPQVSNGQQIPFWIKNNGGLRYDLQISDYDLTKGIEYLINEGIIKT